MSRPPKPQLFFPGKKSAPLDRKSSGPKSKVPVQSPLGLEATADPESGQLVRERPADRASVALRAGALVLLLLAALASWPAGEPPTLVLVVGVLVLGTLAAARPGSSASVFAFLLVMWWWAVADVPLFHWAGFVALVLLVAAHVLLTAGALAPISAPPQRDVLRLWLRRAVGMSAAGALVLLAASLLTGVPESPVLGALALVITLAVVLTVAVRYPSE